MDGSVSGSVPETFPELVPFALRNLLRSTVVIGMLVAGFISTCINRSRTKVTALTFAPFSPVGRVSPMLLDGALMRDGLGLSRSEA